MTPAVTPAPAPTSLAAASAPQTAAPRRRRVAAQGAFEARTLLRNGEQLLVTIVLPVLLLVGLARTSVVSLGVDGTTGTARIDVVVPGVLALAVMSSAFTSQAIATAFDRRNGVLRLLATTPLGRSGLVLGKVLAVLAVGLVQVVVLGAVALALGWRPDAAGLPGAIAALLLGAAAFTSLALLVAGTLRAEGVLAVANLLLVLLAVGGGTLVPASELPGLLGTVAPWLPSGALGDALRSALTDGVVPVVPLLVLLAWTGLFGGATTRWFRWS